MKSEILVAYVHRVLLASLLGHEDLRLAIILGENELTLF
jgi:hypothetical protein